LPICSGKAHVIVSGIVNIAFTRFVCVYWIITYLFAKKRLGCGYDNGVCRDHPGLR